MLTLLPVFAFACLTSGFRHQRMGWRESLLYASVPWALFLAFITEVLTQIRCLTQAGLAWGWLGFLIVCIIWMWRTRSSALTAGKSAAETTPWSWDDRLALIAIVAIAALAALTALVSAPNTWDAMEYHLPRVIEWIKDRGVQFFPTPDRFQLDQPPFAEYAMLHFYLLYGSDRLVALVSWLGYAGCILGVTLIAEELGGGRRSQIVAAVFAATIPTALLEASGTKNEGVAAYWIVVATYLLIRWKGERAWMVAIAIGATLGLAGFSKGTSYLFVPCIVVACFLMWNGAARRRFLTFLPVIVLIGTLVCAPIWIRNYRYTGSIVGVPYTDGPGPVAGRMLENARVTPGTVVANMARNVSLDFGTPSDRINDLSTRAFSGFIRMIGEDPNDPGQINATASGHARKFSVWFSPKYEVLAGDPLPVLLFLFAGLLFLIYHRPMKSRWGWLAAGLMAAFIVDSALLRWSPWNARYKLPLLALGAAFSALVLVKLLPRWTVSLLMAFALLLAIPRALMNDTRPLVTRHGLKGSILTTPRDQTYFFDFHQNFTKPYISLAATVRESGCRSVGLDADGLQFNYPLMALIEKGGIPRHIRYVGVENSTVQFADASAPPVCTVICLDCVHDPEKIEEYSAQFSQVRTFGDQVLFSQPDFMTRR